MKEDLLAQGIIPAVVDWPERVKNWYYAIDSAKLCLSSLQAYCWHPNLARADLGQVGRSDWVPGAVWPWCTVVSLAQWCQAV
jgi:hypothetical protein